MEIPGNRPRSEEWILPVGNLDEVDQNVREARKLKGPGEDFSVVVRESRIEVVYKSIPQRKTEES